jgi:hypothetical protein
MPRPKRIGGALGHRDRGRVKPPTPPVPKPIEVKIVRCYTCGEKIGATSYTGGGYFLCQRCDTLRTKIESGRMQQFSVTDRAGWGGRWDPGLRKVVGGQSPRPGSINGPSGISAFIPAEQIVVQIHRALAKQELREKGLKWTKVNGHDRLVKDENAGQWTRRVAKAQKRSTPPPKGMTPAPGVAGPKQPQKRSVSETSKTGFSVRRVAGSRR